MKDEKVWEKAQKIIESAERDNIAIVSQDRESDAPFLYNQRELVRRINFYLNDRYLERDNNAIFWNISTPRLPHFAKLLQFDTKDFMPIAEGEYNFVKAWALRIKAREWFMDEQFYQTLNDLAEGLSRYGGIIWKAVKKDGKTCLEECKLENMYFDQSADDVKDVDKVEKHFLSKNELYSKQDVWEHIDEVIDKTEDKAEIWEYTGILVEEGKLVFKHVIGYGFGDRYLELWSEEIKKDDDPYEGFRLDRYNGRFLGVGVPERLFKLQERANELVNQNAETTKIASLLLFKSANLDTTGNVLEQAINGQIVSDETLQQVGIQNMGLSQFVAELNLINIQADKLCMTPDVIQGETSPGNTTFRGQALVNAAAENAFTIYRQNLGEHISHILMKWIFPDVVKDWNRQEMVEIAQDDIDIEVYDKAVQNEIAKKKMLNGEELNLDMLAEIENKIAGSIRKIGRRIKTGKNFFDLKFNFKLMPTTETGDKAIMNDAMWNALQIQGKNPAQIDTPLFRQYLENNGISYWKLTPAQKEALQQESQAQPQPQQANPDQLMAAARPQI